MVSVAADPRVSAQRILIAAIALSLGVHLFWLCAIRIVAAPAEASRARFSRVTFLGPILSTARTTVTAARSSRSYLEVRYAGRSVKAVPEPARDAAVRDVRHDGISGTNSAAETRYVGLVGSAVEKQKVEPDYGAE